MCSLSGCGEYTSIGNCAERLVRESLNFRLMSFIVQYANFPPRRKERQSLRLSACNFAHKNKVLVETAENDANGKSIHQTNQGERTTNLDKKISGTNTANTKKPFQRRKKSVTNKKKSEIAPINKNLVTSAQKNASLVKTKKPKVKEEKLLHGKVCTKNKNTTKNNSQFQMVDKNTALQFSTAVGSDAPVKFPAPVIPPLIKVSGDKRRRSARLSGSNSSGITTIGSDFLYSSEFLEKFDSAKSSTPKMPRKPRKNVKTSEGKSKEMSPGGAKTSRKVSVRTSPYNKIKVVVAEENKENNIIGGSMTALPRLIPISEFKKMIQ